jgi:hypothetical protein
VPGRDFLGQKPTQTDETPEAIPTEAAPPIPTRSSEGDEDEEDRVEFGGEVESISAGLWVIDGRSVIVTPDTEIEGDPEVGDRVQVRASRGAGGELVAEQIERDD